MSKFKEKAQDYFDRFTTSEECHISSDGRVFHNIGSAQSFASGLQDTTISTFKREIDGSIKEIEVVAPELVEGVNTDDIITMAEVTAKADKKAEGTPAEGTNDANAKLLAFDTETASYADIKAIASEYKLPSVSLKQADLVAAIVAVQNVLKANQ